MQLKKYPINFLRFRLVLPASYLRGNRWASILSAGALLFLVSTPCWAGGLYITEFGTPSMGVANAGAGAVANDSSIAWHNPAGMTRLSGTHAQATAGLIFGKVKFDADSDTPVPGGDGGNAVGLDHLFLGSNPPQSPFIKGDAGGFNPRQGSVRFIKDWGICSLARWLGRWAHSRCTGRCSLKSPP